jgi:TRAP transporter TAXI family solute receptor
MHLLKQIAATAIALGLSAGLAAAEDKANWPKSFTIATASQGGTFFQYGSGWANIVGEAVGATGSAEVTGGPVQNLTLVQTGDAEFGLTTTGPAKDALEGNSPAAPGFKMDKVRAIFPMYETPFTFLTLASKGWTTWSDLPAGVRVGVGPAGGTADAYWPGMLETLGVKAEIRNAGWSDLTGQLQDGLIDAIAFGAGVPVPAASELEATTGVTFIGFTPEELATIEANFPVAPYTVPANTYRSVAEPMQTVAMWNFAIANADLPDDFVYEVVKTTMENHARMMNVHQSAETTVPENAKFNRTIPWHPGALRYYEEIGAEIADEVK